jgi:hypothetical protein
VPPLRLESLRSKIREGILVNIVFSLRWSPFSANDHI